VRSDVEDDTLRVPPSRGVSALSAIYGSLASLRRSWYSTHPAARRRLARPVISVGNLVVGGSGKTPVVAALSRLLVDLGERPAILSRGYARRNASDGVVVVSDGTKVLATVDESGDEPQMLARTLAGVPVLVSSDRYLAGCLAERRFGATVALLDDGFQHLQLERTIDLLLASPDDLDEKVLPSGRLREPLTAARAADAVLVHGTPEEARAVAARLGIAAAFNVVTRYGHIEAFWPVRKDRASVEVEIPPGGRVVAVAGIARPQRFFAALRDRGCYDVANELTFRDHHWFTAKDVARATAAARAGRAHLIVTTMKDAMRLESPVGRLPTMDIPWGVLPMDVTIEPAGTFVAWLTDRLRHGAREVQRL
jgi:tetraacyldisaccharide 4'-kinase